MNINEFCFNLVFEEFLGLNTLKLVAKTVHSGFTGVSKHTINKAT